jgi:hypothetical protein
MTGQSQAPEIDTASPRTAGMYDYFLGGTAHCTADAQAARTVLAAMPVARRAARVNREFVVRATRWLAAEAGVRQFLDIGSGIPAEPSLHRTAQEAAPEARVVYADNDPAALRHAEPLLRDCDESRTAYMRADFTSPDSVLDAPELGDTLDLGRPVALSLNALLHFVADDRQPYEIVRTLMSALPAGSFLVLTHITGDFADDSVRDAARTVLDVYSRSGSPLRPRSRYEVARFFDGLALVGPGLVPTQTWQPGTPAPAGPYDTTVPSYAGVAHKP